MAYSDYGGHCYRNGESRIDRSDAVLTEGIIKSTPGMWPGCLIPQGRNGSSWHVLMGDGPIFLGLYKQSTFQIFRLVEMVDAVDFISEPDAIETYEDGHYVKSDYYLNNEKPCCIEVDGHKIEIRFTCEDNYYVYAQMKQPDGIVWRGWSGYGVGAGFEDGSYGYSCEDRDETMLHLFSSAMNPDQSASHTT